jgi:hypothetical protein
MHNFKTIYAEVPTIGDIDETTKIVYIHEGMPRKFEDGITVHEQEERKWLKKGHSYTWSHNKAQKKELKFYKHKFGSHNKAKKFLDEEEKNVIRVLQGQLKKDLKKLKP